MTYKTGDRVRINDDAFGDASNFVQFRGRTGEVRGCWPYSVGGMAALCLLWLDDDDGTPLYLWADEISPVQLIVAPSVVQ